MLIVYHCNKFKINDIIYNYTYLVKVKMENKNLIELQKTRKSNLKTLINKAYDGTVDAFAARVGKHKNFIYSLLWDVDNPNNRSISDKMARLFEKVLNLESGYLDKLSETSAIGDYVFLKFIDISDSIELANMSISEETSFPIIVNDLFKKNLVASDLVAVRVFDNSMFPYCDFDDVLIIDTSFKEFRDQQYYLIRYNGKLLIRRLDFGVEGFVFNIENHLSNYCNSINVEMEKNKIKLEGVVVFRHLSSTKFVR